MALNFIYKLVPDQPQNLLDNLHINPDDITEISLVVRDLYSDQFSEKLDLEMCKKYLLGDNNIDKNGMTCSFRHHVKKHPLALAITIKDGGRHWVTTTYTLPISKDKRYLLHPGHSKPIKCYTSFGIRSLIATAVK